MLSCFDFQINVRWNDIKKRWNKSGKVLCLFFFLCFPLHRGKVLAHFYICRFTEIISIIPEIQNMSLQTVQQLDWKTFLILETTSYFKIEVYYLLGNILMRQKITGLSAQVWISLIKALKYFFLSSFSLHNPPSAHFHTIGPHGTFPKLFTTLRCIEFNRLGAKSWFLHCSLIFLQFLIQSWATPISFHYNLMYFRLSFQL